MRTLSALLLLLTPSLLLADEPEYTAYRLNSQHPLTIDGDLSDWPSLPIILLGEESQIANGQWRGAQDSHAKIRLSWDDTYLYFAIEVVDDKTVQGTPLSSASNIYEQDSLQWAIDIRNDGGEGYSNDNYEYGFGVAGGKPVVYRWYATAGWPVGIAEHADLAVKQQPSGVLVYEAALEWSMLAPLRDPQDGQQVKFNIVLQDNDGNERKALGWTPGIVSGKAPDQFGTLTFSKAAPSMNNSGLLISANATVGSEGLDVRVIPLNPQSWDKPLFWHLTLPDGSTEEKQPLSPVDQERSAYALHTDSSDWEAGEYRIEVLDENGQVLATHTVQRTDLSELDLLGKEIADLQVELEDTIAYAREQGLQTKYQLSVLTAAKLFKKYTEEDIAEGKYELALHNSRVLRDKLEAAINQLFGWLDSPDGMPEYMHVPELDFTNVEIDQKNLVASGEPTLLVGPGGWVWELNSGVLDIGDIGYNQVAVGWLAQVHFDDKGQLRPVSETLYPVVQNTIRRAHEKNMSVGTLMICPEQVWMGATRGGDITMPELRSLVDTIAERAIPLLEPLNVFDYMIIAETRRSPALYDEGIHGELWAQYLSDTYGDISELNQLWDTHYTSFGEVPFPSSLPELAAPKYDYTRFRQMMIADELSRTADIIREYDQDAIVHGYPYYHSARDVGVYYRHACDPELDVANMEMVGADSSGPQSNDRYAMAMFTWMSSFYDLMRGIAEERPLNEGEFHFANRRKIYPDNWTRAIYYQCYIHGLDSSYGWVWSHSPNIGAALLLDANVLIESGEVSLDLQRSAKEVIALQEKPDDVYLLYSNASTPHVRTEDGVVLGHSDQSGIVYESLFFDGLQIGYLTDKQVQNGKLPVDKVLIVPNSSHVAPETRAAVEAHLKAGGKAIFIGDVFTHTAHGIEQSPLPDYPTLLRLDGFKDADTARSKLIPALAQMGVSPDVRVEVKNDLPYPTVEWRHVVDGDRELLYVLNIGYDTADVILPASWEGSHDVLTAETFDTRTLPLGSLEFHIIEKKR